MQHEQSQDSITRRDVALFISAVLAFGSLFISFYLSDDSNSNTPPFTDYPPKASENTEKIFESFSTVSIKARSAYVYDVTEERVLYAKNENERLPLASLTKLMTAYVAGEMLPPATVITLENDFLKSEGDNGLYVAEKWRLGDLLDFTLVTSSNDGARAIASVAGMARSGGESYDAGRKDFIQKMNSTADELGLFDTYFLNETGLDENDFLSGAYGSARDMAHFVARILEASPLILRKTRETSVNIISESNLSHTAENTNISIGNIPGIIASKTGFTDLAGGNLVVAFDAGINRPIIISVLGSTQEDRFTDIEVLTEKTLEVLIQEAR